MSVNNNLGRSYPLDELNVPLDLGSASFSAGSATFISPAQLKARARYNLGLGPDATDVSGTLNASIADYASVEEFFDGVMHTTKITLTDLPGFATDDSAALASGVLLYTLPSGAQIVTDAVIAGGLTVAGTPTTDTPEIGLGTTTGTGAAATLSSTMEDYIDGGAAGLIGGTATAPNVAGGAIVKGMLSTSHSGVYVAASGGKAKTVYLNVADSWADLTPNDAPVTFTGTVTMRWRKV